MLAFYVFCLVFGGLFVAMTVFSGLGGDGDLEADGEADLDLDGDGEVDFDADGDGDFDGEVEKDFETHQGRRFRPLRSFKFYTYTMAFFGLTGTLLTVLDMAGAGLALGLSTLAGLGTGLSVSYMLYLGGLSEGGRATNDSDFVGTIGRVLLPVKKGQKGKVRVSISGRSMDVIAITDDEDLVLDLNESCFVLGIEDGVARVVDMSALEERRQG
ncbi:hypothetical protein DL240_11920 [Lujinxingia litoralis]|uniref:NfeD-like C-terminal domain-containing protein n=1 Tax=Lujinxingia litoralis TaxID=2211119 RepID=A0A328C7E7_9DELT|nr:hypothetical protein [Lujinxingia litoralis]RAL21558.1 hypothetical protein DL240_11920 [Lujinxingia litoralis]